VELMQIDTVSSPEMPGFTELGISPHSVMQFSRGYYRTADKKEARG
jgi:NADH dehydrogenase